MSFLEQDIQNDIQERMTQMTIIKTLSSRYSLRSSDEQFLLNYSIPIIYSIWEGYVQMAFQTYIREINKLELSVNNISEHILIFKLESSFKQLYSYPQKHQKKISYLNKMKLFFTDETPIYINPVVNTEGNVGFSTLNTILEQFNLTKISEYNKLTNVSTKTELDEFLKLRNGLAHGNSTDTITHDHLTRAVSLIQDLMELVFASIKEGYDNNTHLSQ